MSLFPLYASRSQLNRKLRDVRNGRTLKELPKHEVTHVSFTPEGKAIVTFRCERVWCQ